MSDNVIRLPEAAHDRAVSRLHPRWWSPVDAFAGLSPSVRTEAEALAARLLAPAVDGPVGGSVAPLHDGWAAVRAVRDALVTAGERGVPHAALRAMHERLDAEAERLAAAAVEERDSAHGRFLEEVSHDIRSPLNSILFLSDALRIEHSGPLTAGQKRQVGVLYSAAVTLVKLVNDLIDFARLGKDHPIHVADTSFAVEAVIADVHRLVGPQVEHRGVELRTRTASVGMRRGDPQLLCRVLLNLVTNAVQAVDEGGSVAVSVSAPRAGMLRVEVTDDAAGTDVERLRRMLCQEVRGETRGWTHGLGLTIAARLVHAAGGALSVETVAGERTCFAVELPFPAV